MLRVLALVEKWKEYEKPMKKFLNDFMAEKKRLEGEALSVFIARTRESATGVCDYLLEQLGERPFHLRGRLNYAVLDSTMSVSFRALARKTKHLKARYAKLTADKTYFAVVTQNTSDEKSVASRFELAEKYLLP
jgi:hypothetical protein